MGSASSDTACCGFFFELYIPNISTWSLVSSVFIWSSTVSIHQLRHVFLYDHPQVALLRHFCWEKLLRLYSEQEVPWSNPPFFTIIPIPYCTKHSKSSVHSKSSFPGLRLQLPATSQVSQTSSRSFFGSPGISRQINGGSPGDHISVVKQTTVIEIIWLVVWLPFFIFPYIGNLIIPTDFHIFQRGGPTTNQL